MYAGHLADSAIQFLNAKIGTNEQTLRQRNKKQVKKDTKLLNAKGKLINFTNGLSNNQSVPIGHLLQ